MVKHLPTLVAYPCILRLEELLAERGVEYFRGFIKQFSVNESV